MSALEELFKNYLPEDDFILKLKEAVRLLHPAEEVTNESFAHTITTLSEFTESLKNSPQLRHKIREPLLKIFTARRSVLLFATSGIYPATGLFSETLRRFGNKFLPTADDPTQSKAALLQIFRPKDEYWIKDVPWEYWANLFSALDFEEVENKIGLESIIEDLLEALRVVAHRIAANGLNPEMLNLDHSLEKHESPFLAQCEEALELTRRIEIARSENEVLSDDDKHLIVLLEQCSTAIERVRKIAKSQGASFHLTFLLSRLQQHITRAERLAALSVYLCKQSDLDLENKITESKDKALENHSFWQMATSIWQEPKTNEHITEAQQAKTEEVRKGMSKFWQHSATMWKELVISECQSNNLQNFWQTNSKLVALRVTENSGKSGEKYISNSFEEYKGILASALGGGFIIAFMAIAKIIILQLGLPPLTQTLIICINYALGFVLIHILHFSVATKQPAMTANAIALSITESQQLEKKLGKENKADAQKPVIQLVARTIRSQIASIIGNVGLAAPIAILFGLFIYTQTGSHFVNPDKAESFLSHYLTPFAISTIFYAAITGVCLFLAGLIDGYYDNFCNYNKIPQRLLQLKWPIYIVGEKLWQKFTVYIEYNLGALVGNICFGFLLGGVNGLGYLLGLPLDVRHITISSAYWGIAIVGLDFAISWQTVLIPAIGVLTIGAANLGVSFYLALSIGLKARGVTFSQQKILLRTLFLYFRKNPREFFIPPRG